MERHQQQRCDEHQEDNEPEFLVIDIFTFLNRRLPTHNPTIVFGFTRFLAIRKRVGDEYLGQFANDADCSLFLVRDARWCVALQREVLRTRSHPSLFRGIRAELDGGTLCRLRARGNRRPPRFCVAWIPLNKPRCELVDRAARLQMPVSDARRGASPQNG